MHGSFVGGHCCVGSMRNLGDFSSQDCTLVRKDHCSALKRPHSSVLKSVVEVKIQDTPQTQDSWLAISTTRSWNLVWADLIDWTWFLNF